MRFSSRAVIAAAFAVVLLIGGAGPASGYLGAYDGNFSGTVSSNGSLSKFSTVRYSPDPNETAVQIGIDNFTSSSDRRMLFAPVNCYNWDLQYGYNGASVPANGSDYMHKAHQCFRIAAQVSPGRDTNGSLTPGSGNTTFNGWIAW